MNIKHPRKLLVVGKRNSGKSSTIEFLIKELTKLGFKIGALKHSSHHHDIDRKGSDSDRYREAGAAPSAFSMPNGCAIYYNGNQDVDQAEILNHEFKDCDILIIESFKHVQGPKLWICSDQDLEEMPEQTIAIIDQNHIQSDLPVFKKNDKRLVSFVLGFFGINSD